MARDWIYIPGGRYRLGLTPEEAHLLAMHSAAVAKREAPELNDGKMLLRSFEIEERTGNTAWLEEYLLEQHPARELEINAFAIARHPVTTVEFKQFMAETGETDEPRSWSRESVNRENDRPITGVSFDVATAFAAWANARLPFEDEWERAVRGPTHRLYPWGNEHAPLGPQILKDYYRVTFPAETTETKEGLQGAVSGREEWCNDLWDASPLEYARVARGGTCLDTVIPSALFRRARDPYSLTHELTSIRLVRADGRAIPGEHPGAPRELRALTEVRRFESRILKPAFAALASSPIARNHSQCIDWSGYIRDIPGAGKLALAAMGDHNGLRAGIPSGDGEWAFGLFFAAASKETVRRIPNTHGVFVYNVQYRLANDGTVRARPIVVYRMAFDRDLHRFENRFRASEADTPIAEITPAMVRASVLDAFQFYEIHADSDEDPFR
jgi:formylglycine-generating enzyme